MVETRYLNTAITSSAIPEAIFTSSVIKSCSNINVNINDSNSNISDNNNCKFGIIKDGFPQINFCVPDDKEKIFKENQQHRKDCKKELWLIDTSTPEALERDFYAWLRGNKNNELKEIHQAEYNLANDNSLPSPPLLLSSHSSLKQPLMSLLDSDSTSQASGNNSFLFQDSNSVALLPVNHNLQPASHIYDNVDNNYITSFSPRSSSSMSSCSSISSSSVSPPSMNSLINCNTVNEFSTLNENSFITSWNGSNNAVLHVNDIKNSSINNNFLSYSNTNNNDMTQLGEIRRSTAGSCSVKNVSEKKEMALNKASQQQQMRSSGTNQLGRTYSPGLPLSMGERERIVELYRSGWKICDISKRLCVTHSCVSKILHRFRTTGSCRPKDAKEGRQESPLVTAIRDYRFRLGMTRQSEIREQLIRDGICSRENAPSRSSINHILRTKLDLKRRKK